MVSIYFFEYTFHFVASLTLTFVFELRSYPLGVVECTNIAFLQSDVFIMA